MRIRRVAWIAPAAVAAGAAFVLSACAAETASPSEIRTRISTHVPPLVDEATAAGDGADSALGALGQGLDALGALMPGLVPEEAAAVFGVAGVGGAARLAADGETPSGAEVADELNTTLFSDANHLGDGVFAIPTDMLCPIGDGATAADPDCVAQAERAALRIRAELAGDDGLDFTLVVGGDRAEPVRVELRAGLVGVSIDLAEVAAAATELGLVDAGTTIELDGVVSARFEIIGPAHVSAAITIDRAIHVAVTSATDPAGDIRLDTAVAHPLARLELDGSADGGIGTAQLGLGATQIRLAADAVAGTPARDLDLPGASATIRLGAGQLLVERFSLGVRATTVMVGGQLGAQLDLNPDTGRTLDLAVTGDATDAAFAFVPGLDLRLAIDHAVIGTAVPPVYDVDRVVIDGAPLPTLRARTTTAGTAELGVVAGELTIGTTPAGYGATIAAGECVGAEDRSGAAGDYTVPVPVACEL
jgi:hypothetical protein